MKNTLLILFLIALAVRVVGLFVFHDLYFDSGRMGEQYTIASNIADGIGFKSGGELDWKSPKDPDSQAYKNLLNMKEKRINVDYFQREAILNKTNSDYTFPLLTDVPGYAIVLGIFWKIFPKSFLPLQIIQIIFDSFMAVLVFLIAELIFMRSSIAYLSSVLYILFVPFILLSSVASRDVFELWGMITATYFSLKIFHSERSLVWVVLSGVSIAFFCWFRPFIIFLPGVYFVYLLLQKKTLFVSFANSVSMFLIVVVFFGAPFSILYQKSTGHYDYWSNTGEGFWEGLGEYPNSYGFENSDDAGQKRLHELGYDGPRWVKESSDLLMDDAMQVVKAHPEYYAKVLLKRLVSMMLLDAATSESFTAKAFIHVCFTAIVIVMFLLVMLALIFYRKEFRQISILLLLYLYKIAIHLPTHYEQRYMFAAYFAILILDAAALVWLYDKVFRKPGDIILKGVVV